MTILSKLLKNIKNNVIKVNMLGSFNILQLNNLILNNKSYIITFLFLNIKKYCYTMKCCGIYKTKKPFNITLFNSYHPCCLPAVRRCDGQ